MRTLLRVAATATFLAGLVVVGAMAISESAYPQDVAAKGDRLAAPDYATDMIQVQRRPPQQPCAPTDVVQKNLLEKYGESRRGIGLGNSGKQVMEIYSTSDGSTWTVVTTDTKGISCVLAGGEHWTDVEQPVPGTDS